MVLNSRLQRLYRTLRRSGIDRFEARDIAPRLLAAAERVDARHPHIPQEYKDQAMGTAIRMGAFRVVK